MFKISIVLCLDLSTVLIEEYVDFSSVSDFYFFSFHSTGSLGLVLLVVLWVRSQVREVQGQETGEPIPRRDNWDETHLRWSPKIIFDRPT